MSSHRNKYRTHVGAAARQALLLGAVTFGGVMFAVPPAWLSILMMGESSAAAVFCGATLVYWAAVGIIASRIRRRKAQRRSRKAA